MAVLSWGKPTIYVKCLSDSGAVWRKFPTPAEDSTTLETTDGEKTEAKFEGGENEDVKYGRNTYELKSDVRVAKGKNVPYADEDGVISGIHAVIVQPEEADCPALYIERSSMHASASYSAADGSKRTYSWSALKAKYGTQIKFGKVTVTTNSSTGAISNIQFKQESVENTDGSVTEYTEVSLFNVTDTGTTPVTVDTMQEVTAP